MRRSIFVRLCSAFPVALAALFVATLLSSALFASGLGNGGGEAWRRGLLGVWLALAIIATWKRPSRPSSRWTIPLTAGLLGLAALGALGVTDVGLAAGRLGDFLLLFASLLLAIRMSSNQRAVLLLWIFFGTSIASLSTLVAAPWPLIDSGGGILNTRNLSATFAALGLPFAARSCLSKRFPSRRLAFGAAFSCGAYLLLSGNRLGAIAGLIGLALLCLPWLRRSPRLAVSFGLLVALAIFALAPLRTSVTVSERLSLASASIGSIAKDPLFGVGTGQWAVDFPGSAVAAGVSESIALRGNRQPAHAHNDLLELWVELGLPGALVLALLLALGIRALFSRSPSSSAHASSASIASFAILSLGAFPLAQPGALVLLGLLLAEPQGQVAKPNTAAGFARNLLPIALLALISFSAMDISLRRDLAKVRQLTSGIKPDFAAALPLVERARERAAWSFSADRLAAWVLSVNKRPSKALASAEAALSKRPNHPGALNDLALCLGAMNRRDETEPLLRAALASAPRDPEIALNLADLLASDASHATEAKLLFRQALGNNANLTTAWTGLAKLAQRRGDLKQSIALHQAARDSKLRNQLYLKKRASDGRKGSLVHPQRPNLAKP